eukprot:3049424-Pyramimonas_sp.AAC.1
MLAANVDADGGVRDHEVQSYLRVTVHLVLGPLVQLEQVGHLVVHVVQRVARRGLHVLDADAG